MENNHCIHPGLIAVMKLQMESKELKQSTASDENELLENGIKTPNVEAFVKSESDNQAVDEGKVPSTDDLSEAVADPVVADVETPVIDLKSIPTPVSEVAGTNENTLIDQIVQLSQESEEDDDLFGDGEPDGHIIPVHDYSSYSKVQLVNTLRKILSESTTEEIRPHAEAIKGCFYKIRNGEIQEQKLAFTAEGNDEELFEPKEDPQEAELKDLL